MRIKTYGDSQGTYGLCIEPASNAPIEDVRLIDNSLLQSNVFVVEMTSSEMFELAIDMLNQARKQLKVEQIRNEK